ncbi:MAG: hypothetical protein SPI25_07010 [Dialister sp.]|nr:hypothetical protein [Dialister sp.]
MKKTLLSLAAAVFLLTGSACANWTEGNTSTLAAANGEAAVQMNLTTDQKLGINIYTEDAGRADAIFSTDASDSTLSLSELPLKLTHKDGGVNALVWVTQFVNTDSGRRFYIIQTGNIQGLRIVSYRKGTYQMAFEPSALDPKAEGAYLEIQKKKLILHIETPEGEKSYDLVYNSSLDSFTASPLE